MKSKDDRNNKLTLKDILTILKIVSPILSPSLLQFFPFFSKFLLKLSATYDMQLSVLRWLIVLSSFVILSLVLSLLCVIKTQKKKLPLPPKKDIKKIIKYLIHKGSVSTMILMNELGYSNTKALHYPKLLKDAKYLCGAFMINPPSGGLGREVHYGLGENGEKFAIKHKLD